MRRRRLQREIYQCRRIGRRQPVANQANEKSGCKQRYRRASHQSDLGRKNRSEGRRIYDPAVLVGGARGEMLSAVTMIATVTFKHVANDIF